MARKKMHLAQFLVHGPTYHSLAMWRHPETAARNYDWTQPELYQHIAQVCERGKFDMVFFADLNYISDTFRNSLEPALRYAAQAPEHDPIPLITSMAAVTSHVGLGATFSVSHHNPFYAARLWATLDHLTKGRAAWNVVTSLNHNQAANYGEERADTDSRYDRAHEFVEVCQKLWQSWDEDAVVMDRENAIFADANKVHRIEHEGEFFKSRGPLNVVRPRHGAPPIIQAGTSPKGMDLAAKYAEAIFAIQPRVENAAEYYAAVKGRMDGFGRRPEECKILFGMQPIIGASEAEAVEKQELHNSLMPLDGGMTILSSHMDFDLSKLDPNEKIAERTEPELQRMHSRFLKPSGESMTVAEVAQRHGEGVSLPQFVGTPEAIVDQMEAYIDVVGGDGFMISPIYCPGAIEEFVDQVVPELQRRGLFRTDYAGTTQRDHLGQYD
ncbi:MAG: LLM class flavin-dependent oxidoreductase [Rhodospirillaceae bacterium]|nr:LLM class flavin-dependent oxidoreductase [Rhodospirillaceae bacterium]